MQIPAVIICGDTATWRDQSTKDRLGNAIDATWTLTWYFNGPTTLSVVSTAYSDGWETSISAVQSAALTPTSGRDPNYFWQAVATKGAQRITIGEGSIRVTPSLAAADAGYDGRSQAEADLENVQAALRARIAGGAISEYWIGTRRLKNEGIAELMKLETRLKLIVSKERRARMKANGLGDPRNTYVRF